MYAVYFVLGAYQNEAVRLKTSCLPGKVPCDDGTERDKSQR